MATCSSILAWESQCSILAWGRGAWQVPWQRSPWGCKESDTTERACTRVPLEHLKSQSTHGVCFVVTCHWQKWPSRTSDWSCWTYKSLCPFPGAQLGECPWSRLLEGTCGNEGPLECHLASCGSGLEDWLASCMGVPHALNVPHLEHEGVTVPAHRSYWGLTDIRHVTWLCRLPGEQWALNKGICCDCYHQ